MRKGVFIPDISVALLRYSTIDDVEELLETGQMEDIEIPDQRPHGEWHTTPNPNHSPFDSTSEVIYMCSKCDYSNGDRIAAAWNFCPNCGADMRKEGEEK